VQENQHLIKVLTGVYELENRRNPDGKEIQYQSFGRRKRRKKCDHNFSNPPGSKSVVRIDGKQIFLLDENPKKQDLLTGKQ